MEAIIKQPIAVRSSSKFMSLFRDELTTVFQEMLSWIPGRLGILIRRYGYHFLGADFGSGIKADGGVFIHGFSQFTLGKNALLRRSCFINATGAQIVIGDDFALNYNSCIDATPGGEIVIGHDVLIAQNVVIRAGSHEFRERDKPIREQGHRPGKIIIGDHVWIGANAVITGTVTIGEGAVISAGAIVTRDVPPYSVCLAMPAKTVMMRE